MRRAGVITIAGVLVIAGAVGAWFILRPADAANEPKLTPRIPVNVAAATARDIPVNLLGLGTVQAYNAIDIRAQVSGVLEAVPVTEGQEVAKGTLVAVIDPRPFKAALDRANAQLQADQAQLQDAKLDLQRFKTLAKDSFSPQQQVDSQQALASKEAAAVASDTAAIETAQLNLDYCFIRSPVAGRVSLRRVDPGNLIEEANQTTVVSITQDKPISVVFTLPESQLPRVQAAMRKGALPVTALTSDDSKTLAQGTLLTPDNAIDTTTGTITMKATFANDDDALWPGEFINTHLLVDTLKAVLTVPHMAVQHGPEGLSVYVLKPDKTAARVPVQTGYDDGTYTVIEKGLQAGQPVVTSGQSRLGDGTPVSVGSPSS